MSAVIAIVLHNECCGKCDNINLFNMGMTANISIDVIR